MCCRIYKAWSKISPERLKKACRTILSSNIELFLLRMICFRKQPLYLCFYNKKCYDRLHTYDRTMFNKQ